MTYYTTTFFYDIKYDTGSFLGVELECGGGIREQDAEETTQCYGPFLSATHATVDSYHSIAKKHRRSFLQLENCITPHLSAGRTVETSDTENDHIHVQYYSFQHLVHYYIAISCGILCFIMLLISLPLLLFRIVCNMTLEL